MTKIRHPRPRGMIWDETVPDLRCLWSYDGHIRGFVAKGGDDHWSWLATTPKGHKHEGCVASLLDAKITIERLTRYARNRAPTPDPRT